MTKGKTWGSLAPGGAPRFATPSPNQAPAHRRTTRVLVATMCLTLVGCGEPRLAPPDDASGSFLTGTPASSPPALAEATPVPSLGEVVWAAAADPVTNAPQAEVTNFAPDAPRIAAFLLVGSLPAGATIQAEWEYNDTTLDAFTRQVVVPTATERTWLSFHIDRGEAESWPAGVYAVIISLDGQTARQASIQVVAPA